MTQDGCEEDYTSIISIGFLASMAICIPFGYINLVSLHSVCVRACVHGNLHHCVFFLCYSHQPPMCCCCCCWPHGMQCKDENMWFQWLSLVGLVAFTLEFLVQFVLNLSK